jgi:hypothetical protein
MTIRSARGDTLPRSALSCNAPGSKLPDHLVSVCQEDGLFGREWLRVQRLASGNVPSSHASSWVLATWPVPAAGWALAAEQVSCTPVEVFHLARCRLAAPPLVQG